MDMDTLTTGGSNTMMAIRKVKAHQQQSEAPAAEAGTNKEAPTEDNSIPAQLARLKLQQEQEQEAAGGGGGGAGGESGGADGGGAAAAAGGGKDVGESLTESGIPVGGTVSRSALYGAMEKLLGGRSQVRGFVWDDLGVVVAVRCGRMV